MIPRSKKNPKNETSEKSTRRRKDGDLDSYKVESIDIAEQLGYSNLIISKIRAARSEIAIDAIMISARHSLP